MSDTPRTDAQLEICQRDPLVPLWPLCKELERENAKLREALEGQPEIQNKLMTADEYAAACDCEIRKAEEVCGKDAPQAQLVGHLSGEVVRLRAEIDRLTATLDAIHPRKT